MHVRLRPRRLAASLCIVLLLLLFLYLTGNVPRIQANLAVLRFHLSFKYHHALYTLGLTSLLSKEPLVQVIGQDSYEIVFDFRHDRTHAPVTVLLAAKPKARHVAAQLVPDRDGAFFVYRARISEMTEGQVDYRIQSGSWSSKRYTLTALGGDPETPAWRLGVVGDNQFAASLFTRVLQHLTCTARSLDGMIHVGDAVQTAASARAWSTDFFMPVHANGLGRVPWLMARGNHDAPSVYGTQVQSVRVILPGNICLIVLDSTTEETTQETWLTRTLTSTPCSSALKRIVVVHIPPFVEFWEKKAWFEGKESEWGQIIHDRYAPLFEKHAVDLVLSGHQHNYQRGVRKGVMYVTTGGAGGTLDRERVVEPKDSFMSVTWLDYHYGVLEWLPQGVLSFTMRTLDDQIRDQFFL